MRIAALGAVVVLALSLAPGAAAVQGHPSATDANPTVRALVRGVNDDRNARALEVRKLDVTVRLRGAVAETSLEMRLLATTPEPVEGRVHVDLPAGAIVTGYAVDVGGALIEGSLVDAPKAKAAYEQQVRRNIDPGLAEIDAAGGFTTRVSPIDDKKGRTVRLTFVSPLREGWELPLNVSAKDGWSVRVAPTAGSRYSVALGSKRSLGGELDERGIGRLAASLRIDTLQTDETIASRHPNGELYWQASGMLPGAAQRSGGTVRILWDRSRSRRDQDHAAELRRVEEALASLASKRIEWLAFSSGEPQRAVLAGPRDVTARATGVRYAGATSFQSVVGEPAADVCLLVSDGRATLDQAPIQPLPCRVFAIVSDRSADQARLAAIASATGGQVVDTGSGKIDWHAPAVEAVFDAAGTRLDFVPLPAPRGQWRIATRAPASGPIQVRVGGSSFQRAPSGTTQGFTGEAAMLAAVKLASLEGSGARKEFVDLSRRYSVASPSLSFVVLETPQDYVSNDIAPPQIYPRFAEWRELRSEADEDEADAKARRFDTLLKNWTEQVAWWERKFDLAARPAPRPSPKAAPAPAIAPPPPPPPGRQNCPDGSVILSTDRCPVPPPPPPPPPPSAERDDGSDEAVSADAAQISVTGTRIQSANLMSSPVTVVNAPADIRISVAAWQANRDYLAAFDADPAAFDRIYAEWERKAGDVPAFYLDTADWLARHQRNDRALETLLSALDLPTADLVTVGMVAARLERYGMLDDAIILRERQAQLDPDRPQPRRLLALALARRAALGGPAAKADLDRAIRLLADIALSPIDDRWQGIDLISLVEANAFLPRLQALGGNVELDRRLVRNLDSDVRVVLDWSNDDADIDLWVDEPSGERAIYSHARTLIGGHLSNDMTDGYGPEEYFLRRAADGRYIVRANVYSPDQLDPNGPSRVTAHLYRDWGRPTQRVESIDLDLAKGVSGEVRIGTLTVQK